MSFRPQAVRGAQGAGAGDHPGQIDYRLARNALVSEFRRGRLSRLDVCDAHPELMRAAVGIGSSSTEICPICEVGPVVHVSYAFGSRLPPGGQSYAGARELDRILRRATPVTCYVIEVCPACGWNHLARTYGAARRRRAPADRGRPAPQG
ncbi:MAG: DUF5318 family protein [Acidimicrobiales bacterium]